MRFNSIDVETTGLDCEKDLLLSIAIINFDPKDRGDVKSMSINIKHEMVVGNIFAICMNAELLKEINRGCGVDEVEAKVIINEFLQLNPGIWCGKNVGFDLGFFDKLMGTRSRHGLDPSIFWLHDDDESVRSLNTLKERAGITGLTAHNAYDDAMTVCELFWRHYGV